MKSRKRFQSVLRYTQCCYCVDPIASVLFLAEDEKIVWVEGYVDQEGNIRTLLMKTDRGQVWCPIETVADDEDMSEWMRKTSPNIEGLTLAYLKGYTSDTVSSLMFDWQ